MMWFRERDEDELVRLRAELKELRDIMVNAKATNGGIIDKQMNLAGQIAVLERRCSD